MKNNYLIIKRKIRYNIKAKKHAMGVLIIVMLVLLTAFSSMMMILSQSAKADPEDYLYCISITINHDKVNQTLANFPVWVYNVSDDFADNILENGADIAFYDYTNTTRFNHEIELWNKTTGEIGIWVNVTSILADTDTVLYMYYCDPDTSDTPNYNPTDVWDSHYTHVWHMNDSTTSTIWDSVTGTTLGDKKGVNEPVENDSGIAGYCQDWGIDDSDDYIVFDGEYIPRGIKTLECWVSMNIFVGEAGTYIINNNGGSTTRSGTHLWTGPPYAQFQVTDAIVINPVTTVNSTTITFVNYTWYYIACSWDNTIDVDTTRLYADGYLDNEETAVKTESNAPTNPDCLGARSDDKTRANLNGVLDEVRYSNYVRNSSWINTTYNTINDPSTFLTFGSQQISDTSSFSLDGLTSGRLTWHGMAGDIVWSNSSGDGYETMEIIHDVNETDTITEDRIFLGDLNTSGNGGPPGYYLNASNITMYASSDNSNFGVPIYDIDNGNGVFLDGGCNITLNATTWDDGTMGANPFPITDECISIYVRFKLVIPGDLPTDTFYSESSTAWKVHIGYYV